MGYGSPQGRNDDQEGMLQHNPGKGHGQTVTPASEAKHNATLLGNSANHLRENENGINIAGGEQIGKEGVRKSSAQAQEMTQQPAPASQAAQFVLYHHPNPHQQLNDAGGMQPNANYPMWTAPQGMPPPYMTA